MKSFVVGILLISLFLGGNYLEHKYTRENCVVVEVNGKITTFEDSQGNLWDAYCDGFAVGDVVDLKMNDACTTNTLDDDEVLDIIKK